MCEISERSAVPRHDQIERGFVACGFCGQWRAEEKALGVLALAIPLVRAGKRPCRVGSALGAAVLFYEAVRDCLAHRLVDGCRVFAAQAESFEEALAHRGDVDPEFSHSIIDNRLSD